MLLDRHDSKSSDRSSECGKIKYLSLIRDHFYRCFCEYTCLVIFQFHATLESFAPPM